MALGRPLEIIQHNVTANLLRRKRNAEDSKNTVNKVIIIS